MRQRLSSADSLSPGGFDAFHQAERPCRGGGMRPPQAIGLTCRLRVAEEPLPQPDTAQSQLVAARKCQTLTGLPASILHMKGVQCLHCEQQEGAAEYASSCENQMDGEWGA